MGDPLFCPVCEKVVYSISRWRGLYLCTPCFKKYEKIEALIQHGQVLAGPKLQAVLKFFGEEELANIKNAKLPKTPKKKVQG
jgi:hypothetical protein